MLYRTGTASTYRNDAFQEVDIVGITRNITKYSVTVRDRKDLGKIIKMAFHIARTGKPGPVLIDLPKDIQTASGPAEYPDKVEIRGYRVMIQYMSDSLSAPTRC